MSLCLQSTALFQEKQYLQPKSKSRISRSALRDILEGNQNNKGYDELLETRTQLPVYQHKEQVLAAVRREQVTVIAGETGSGKSTQVPQFILEVNLYSDQF